MDSLSNFLTFYIDKMTADHSIPIDVNRVAEQIGAVVEEREMIPEAAMDTKDGRFHIYLQSNFKGAPGAALRSRFSLAHEIGHTLFYERCNGEFKARKDAPRGEHLESACHKAAAMLLVPSQALQRELRQGNVPSAEAIVDLANRFEVSTQVMLRRLHELQAFENDWAPVLTRGSGPAIEIEYAAYPPWLKAHLGKPTIGTPFTSWFQPTENREGILSRPVLTGRLEAKPVQVSASKTIFEVRFMLF